MLFIFLQISPQARCLCYNSEIKVCDVPNDAGNAISIEWKLSPTDSLIAYYNILRANSRNARYDSVGTALKGTNRFEDKSVKDGKFYWYKIRAVLRQGQVTLPTQQVTLPTQQANLPTQQANLPTQQNGGQESGIEPHKRWRSSDHHLPGDTILGNTLNNREQPLNSFVESEPSDSVMSYAQWFHHKRWNVLILGLMICGFALIYISLAKKGVSLFIRNIPGLEAVDEAVGRATEMGRPILYITGLGDMSDISTIASLSILERVAKKAALHGTALIVPGYDPVVMSAAQEVVKQAHDEAGRPDTYDESKIFYLTADQFGYAAGVDGIMLRERPGAVFMQGAFFAEALVIAETGNSIGAIQISGTSSTSQLPFFVAACDYTLIGEEMFAASAYLSKEPLMLGSIKGEDYAKLIVILVIIIGVVLATIASLFGKQSGFVSGFIEWFTAI